MLITDFGNLIAERMRIEHRALAARWFARLLDLLPVDARQVFPTQSLLDHVPALILEISAYLDLPGEQAIAANTAILDKARELGALRHGQRASLHQVLREYQVLNNVLVTFVLEEIERLSAPPPAVESVVLVARLNHAVAILSQSTVEAFVTLYTQTISDQSERLEQFTRMAAHEWRQPLGTLLFAIKVLREPDLDAERTQRTLALVERNIEQLSELTHKLERVARLQTTRDTPLTQDVSIATVAHEAARQLRDMATARNVVIQIGEDLPNATVDVGRLELVFVNLLSNAIKYSDPSKADRRVDITGVIDGDSCRITVRDNGLGIPKDVLPTVFQRFTRAPRDRATDIAGVGLGLSIAEDCMRAIGGYIEVQSAEGQGTEFALIFPAAPK